MKADRPVTDTAVICGSLHIADRKILAAVDEYSRNLAIGHVLPVAALKQSTKLEIIYEGCKYSLEAHQVGGFFTKTVQLQWRFSLGLVVWMLTGRLLTLLMLSLDNRRVCTRTDRARTRSR